ncbi:hypothetical protein AURDEDRAFT_164219 [Auricularia subglabra TFB-10046 SS5]|nr:hypothetical protein AURDEDRAFT_164219 [Auricularia subglabra TFB-10046 SS5]
MVSTAEVEFVNNILRFVPVTLLVYDWTLTLGDEVELIWNKRPKTNQLVFLALRYGTLALMSLTVLYFVPVSEQVRRPSRSAAPLRIQTWVSAGAMIVIILFVQVLLQVRVYAMYNRSRAILWTNAVLFVVECAITVFLFLHLSERITSVPVTSTQRCRTCSIYPRAFGLAYVAPLVYESYLMVLAARKSWSTRDSSLRLDNNSIIDVLARGSIQYFALVASGMAISMVLFLAAPRFALWVDFLSDATGSIGGTRLLLSVRKALLEPAQLSHSDTTQMAVRIDTNPAGNISAASDSLILA